ncbi:MAG: GldM family protein [Bacteroidota bacterium]
MAGGKETPRQKMIGMMYLVLTALLALNVSKEIINAFVKLDDKLLESNKVLNAKSEATLAEFDKARAAELLGKVPESQSQVLKWKKVALEIRGMAYRMDKFIQIDCRNKLLAEVEGKDFVKEENQKFIQTPLMEVEQKDNYDAATRLFGGEVGTEGYNFGEKIRNTIHEFRDSLVMKICDYEYNKKKFSFNPKNVKDGDSASLEAELKNVYPEDKDKVKSIYNTLSLKAELNDGEVTVVWQLGMFDHAPVVAAAALFTSLSNDVRLAEAQALEIVQSRVKVPTFNFNKIEPMAFARTGYLNVGDSMSVTVQIAAYDSSEVPEIKFKEGDSSIWENHASVTEMVKGKIPVKATGSGVKTLYGVMSVKEKGEVKWKRWKYTYEVGEPAAVVSNEDLSVIYAGYEHTFSASASGFPQAGTTLSIPGVSCSPAGNGKFKVKAPSTMVGKKVKSQVSAKSGTGGSKSFQGPEYFVKSLPKPSSFFGGIASTESRITKAQINANMTAGVKAGYDPSMPLDPSKVRFNVTGFELVVTVGGNTVRKTSNSGKFTAEMTQVMNALKPGMNFSIGAIRATGPAGEVRVTPMSFVVQ